MNDTPNLDHAQRQAWRYDAQDGLMEFLAGILFFFVARSVVDPHLAWVPALLIFPMRWASKFFKERFTYPRVGYVKLKSEDGRDFGRGVFIFLAIVLAIMAAAMANFGDITSWDQWMKWMPALMGGFTSGGFLYVAGKTGLPRHRVLVVVCIGWGVACSVMPVDNVREGMQRWALGIGLVCLVMGLVIFLTFLRRHPVRVEEVGDEQA